MMLHHACSHLAPLLKVTDTSQTHSQSHAHSHCDITHVMYSTTGRATVSHLAIIQVWKKYSYLHDK